MRSGGLVLVVDDDQGIRDLVCQILSDAGFVTRQADSGAAGLELARRERPRLVILDVQLPGISGYEVCYALRQSYGDDLAILFLSGERTLALDRAAGLLIGADDYLAKPFHPDELLARVRRLTRRVAIGPRQLASKLTGRELDVLRLLAHGLGPADIAEHLVISPKTVATHIEHIFLKLGVQTRAQAVAVAYRDDLLSVSSSGTTETLSVPGRSVSKQVTARAPERGPGDQRTVSATSPLSPPVALEPDVERRSRLPQ